MTTKKTILALIASLLILAPLAYADDAATVAAGTPVVAEAVPAAPSTAPTAGDVAKLAAAAAAEAAAPPVTETPKLPDTTLVDEDVSGFVKLMIDAFNAKNWGVFAGLVIMALVWILKKFIWKALPTSALPWVAAGAGIVAAVSTGLIAGVVWWQAILNGLLVGAAGGGLWSLVGKHVFGKNEA
jgi:hypothetical protein